MCTKYTYYGYQRYYYIEIHWSIHIQTFALMKMIIIWGIEDDKLLYDY